MLYTGETKAAALKAVSNLPDAIQKGVKSFFKGSSNHYDSYHVTVNSDGTYTAIMENPGRVPGSRAIYYKVLDAAGHVLRVYKETYDPQGNLVHTKEK